MSYTRDCDWEEGSNPIVFQSVNKTAMDLCITERQVRRMEQKLCELGALTWCDSGNYRRYGQRDPKTGELLYAFGVDLTPLAALREPLQSFIAQKAIGDKQWRNTKRKISWYRAQLRSMFSAIIEAHGVTPELDALQARYEPISAVLRIGTAISTLTNLLDAHMDLHGDILPMFKSLKLCGLLPKESAKEDKNVRHIQDTKQLQLDKSKGSPADRGLQESKKASSVPKRPKLSQPNVPEKEKVGSGRGEAEIIQETGLQHITLKQALNAASEQLRAHIPLEPRPMNWNDMVEAAYRRARELGIGQHCWAAACGTLGRTGAAVAVLIVDRGSEREDEPVRQPGAYLRAMIARAQAGELNLHASIFAWLKREEVASEGEGVI